MPDVREVQRNELISQYLKEVEPLNSEPARSQRFGMLLHALFSVVPAFIEEFSQGVEKYLKVRQKDRILKGRADNLFGNVIIEFEADLTKTRAEAEEQLRRYAAILWSQEPASSRTPYLCLAADGVRFISYTPLLHDPQAQEILPETVDLRILEEVDWRKFSSEEIFFWLDRYFLRKEIYRPTSELIEKDFGLSSHAFQTANAALLTLWREVKDKSAFAVVFDAWDKYLRVVYGSKVAGDELFVRHTYLATLAKLLAWQRLTESAELPGNDRILHMLEGKLFKDLDIDNFLEEDFFSWIARSTAQATALQVVRALFSLLSKYRLRELSEDVLKSLYQELVDPETRHDLGEFYTPDWLAHRMIGKMLDANPQGTMLDPACGSGTFLYLAIKEKRRRLEDSRETLDHILASVYGVDIHPLAVITAKTNYILALGDLLKKRVRPVVIPVFLANTINLPEREVFRSLFRQVPSYRVKLAEEPVYLPEVLLDNLEMYDRTIEHIQGFALDHRGKTVGVDTFRNFLRVRNFPHADEEPVVDCLFEIAMALKRFLEEERDTIWSFILKNVYKPLFLKGRFDFLMGNPPWIALHYLEPDYQKFLKGQFKDYRLLTGRGHLIANTEVGTLFLVRAADLYLKKGGQIGFVLPRSIFTADQHDELRRGTFRFTENRMLHLLWSEAWDSDKVTPLFNVPTCVLWGEKVGPVSGRTSFPGEIFSGVLPRKNASLQEAEENLAISTANFSLHHHGRRTYWAPGEGTVKKTASFYKKRFFEGANIYPRTFWFVQLRSSSLGFNPQLPPLATDPRAVKEAKKPYNEVQFSGQVESQFLYATLLSTDLLPFGHLNFRLMVLPIEPGQRKCKLLNADEAREQGFSYLAKWLERVEREWIKRRGIKAGDQSAIDWINYRKKLTNQNPDITYLVIYNSSGTIPTSSVIRKDELLNNTEQIVNFQGFVVDKVTIYFRTSNLKEAYYLSAIINAPEINNLIKPMQARGLWGPRHIQKKILELPIPQFEAGNLQHERLAELGEFCTRKVRDWLAQGGPGQVKSIGRLRQLVRALLREELKEIDILVKQIL